jgi:hypothetical protein
MNELNREKLTNRIKLYHEQVFYKTGHLPINADVEEMFSRELASLNIEYYELLPAIVKWTQDSGLLEQDFNGYLEPQQFLIAQMFLNTSDRRSIRQKLKEANVSVSTWNNWNKQPTFRNYIRKEATRRFGDADISADLELVKHVEDGNLEGIKYYNQMSGRYSTPEAVNVSRVLALMMEILVQYVTADVLTKIAKELELKIYSSLLTQNYPEEPKQLESTTSAMEIKF